MSEPAEMVYFNVSFNTASKLKKSNFVFFCGIVYQLAITDARKTGRYRGWFIDGAASDAVSGGAVRRLPSRPTGSAASRSFSLAPSTSARISSTPKVSFSCTVTFLTKCKNSTFFLVKKVNV